MIYTRFGTPVKLLTCEVVRERSRRGDEFDQYYVTAETAGARPSSFGTDATAKASAERTGRPILGGKQFPAHELRADGGLGEIIDACKTFNPAVCAG